MQLIAIATDVFSYRKLGQPHTGRIRFRIFVISFNTAFGAFVDIFALN